MKPTLPSLSASQASVRNPNAGLRGALREQLSDVRANQSDLCCGRDKTIQTTNGLVSAILRRKVPIKRIWALRFREKLRVCVGYSIAERGRRLWEVKQCLPSIAQCRSRQAAF